MNDKKSFLIYHDIEPLLKELSDTDAGKLIKAMVHYSATGEESSLSKPLKLAFIGIKTAIDRNAEKYETMCQKNRENATKRWERMPKDTTASDRMRPHAMDADSDSDSDKDINTNTSFKGKTSPSLKKPLPKPKEEAITLEDFDKHMGMATEVSEKFRRKHK